MKIQIVCATRLSAAQFHSDSALGRSLSLYPFPFVNLRLFANNSLGLSTVYNQSLRELRAAPAFVLFVHDDVHLMDIYWPDRIAQGLSAFDIIGVAGNVRRAPNQPSWRFVDERMTLDKAQYLSGAIAHGSGWPARQVSYYGTIGREVKLLDGVLLAARSEVLVSRDVFFDEQFDFHFYDLDFCRQAERQNLRMGTWPIPIIHESGGRFDGPMWTEALREVSREVGIVTTRGRNERCSCGSGKKFKRCCGSPTVASSSGASSNAAVAATTPPGRLVELAKSKRYRDLELLAQEMLDAQPRSGLAWKALSVALQMQGKEALQAAERAAQLLPGDVDCQSNLGAALRRQGRLQDALVCFRRALVIKPEVPELWNNLGNVQRDLGQFDDAIGSYRRALELRPSFPQPHNNLGNVLLSVGKLDEAMASYQRAIALDPRYVDARINLGIVQRRKGDSQEAEESCRCALALDAESAGALRLLAELRSDKGEFTLAEELYKKVIAIEPDSTEAWAGIAGLRRMTLEDTEWLDAARRIVERAPVTSELYLRYALGKFFDDVGDYEQAFANYRQANELAIRSRPAYDRRLLALCIRRTMERYDETGLARLREAAIPSERPVFIIGMPRSGTTLAEQILASHGQVFGAGELPYWNTAAEMFARESDAAAAALHRSAEEYLGLLAARNADARRVVDKMPGNFLHLGLIHSALPKAKIIHLHRNPIDTCLSIYFQNFGAMHPYANDLEDLADYYRQYLLITRHWSQTLAADAILDVPYEGLVEDTEAWSRRMVHFTGLPWDPGCLQFYNNDRTVSTFSRWQARQRISRGSIGRWRHYEQFIAPLISLADAGSANHLPAAGRWIG